MNGMCCCVSDENATEALVKPCLYLFHVRQSQMAIIQNQLNIGVFLMNE